jgi:hypothetical protein
MDTLFLVKLGLFIIIAIVAVLNFAAWVESGEE